MRVGGVQDGVKGQLLHGKQPVVTFPAQVRAAIASCQRNVARAGSSRSDGCTRASQAAAPVPIGGGAAPVDRPPPQMVRYSSGTAPLRTPQHMRLAHALQDIAPQAQRWAGMPPQGQGWQGPPATSRGGPAWVGPGPGWQGPPPGMVPPFMRGPPPFMRPPYAGPMGCVGL